MKKIILVLSLLIFTAVPAKAEDDLLTARTLTMKEQFSQANTQEALAKMALDEMQREKKAWVSAKDENKLICQRIYPEEVLNKENYNDAVECFLSIINKTVRSASPAPELIDDLASKWRASVKKYETAEITKEQLKIELDDSMLAYISAHADVVEKTSGELLPKLPKEPPVEAAPAEGQAQ